MDSELRPAGAFLRGESGSLEIQRREDEGVTGMSGGGRSKTVAEKTPRLFSAPQLFQADPERELRLGDAPGFRREESAAPFERFL